jgi:predicted amidophosphoribosyltransferase
MRAGEGGRRLLAGALDLLLPAGCLACRGWMGPASAEPRYLCPGCATRVKRPGSPACSRCGGPVEGDTREDTSACPGCHDWPPGLATARAAAVLAPPADDLVHALKYGGWPEAAEEMALAMLPLLPRGGPHPLLVPVPTTPARERRRGYNQARVLALALAARGGLEVVELLRRTRESGSQVALHREERMANVDGAFAPVETVCNAVRSRVLAGAPVILIDDVLTTGATASAAARALEEAGFPPVHLLTYGRADPGRKDGDHTLLPPPGFFQNWIRRGRSRAAPR